MGRILVTMAEKVPLIIRLIASSVSAANQAGTIIRDVMNRGELGIVEKGKNDYQTEADRSAQQCIVASLSAQFPAITIIGEEGASNNTDIPNEWIVKEQDQEVLKQNCPTTFSDVANQDVVVWVDPLDGTSEYTQGLLDHVTVLVGIAVKGKAIAGVIHQPYYNYKQAGSQLGRTLWGLAELGVGGFTVGQLPSDKFIVTTTRSHSNKTVQAALDAIHPTDVLKVGGAGHKVMLLLEGRAHAYVFASPGCKKWDTCAPEAILTAAGGRLTDMHGKVYSYDAGVAHVNKGGVLATAPGVDFSAIVSKIPESVLDDLK